jgi:hypothetical protein
MRKNRIALGSAVLAAGLALAGATPANAQVRFEGSFPLPHGRISVGFGDPAFPVGAVVPYGYSVYSDPSYGYGFNYEDSWIPCEPYGNQWIVVERPGYFGHGYVRPYRSYGYYSRPYRYYSRPYRRWDDRRERFERREHERFEHRDFGRGWRR